MPASEQATSAASTAAVFVVKKNHVLPEIHPAIDEVVQPKRVELELRPWNEFLVAAWWHTDVDRNRPAEGEAVIAFHSLWEGMGFELGHCDVNFRE